MRNSSTRLDGLDLNLLLVLEALIEEKSVTRASVRLGISQSGISAALQTLRSHYADELLEQIGQRFFLTACAEQIEEPLKKVLAQIRDILEAAPEPSGNERVISNGALPTGC